MTIEKIERIREVLEVFYKEVTFVKSDENSTFWLVGENDKRLEILSYNGMLLLRENDGRYYRHNKMEKMLNTGIKAHFIEEINKFTKVSINQFLDGHYEMAVLTNYYPSLNPNNWNVDYQLFDDIIMENTDMGVYGRLQQIEEYYFIDEE